MAAENNAEPARAARSSRRPVRPSKQHKKMATGVAARGRRRPERREGSGFLQRWAARAVAAGGWKTHRQGELRLRPRRRHAGLELAKITLIEMVSSKSARPISNLRRRAHMQDYVLNKVKFDYSGIGEAFPVIDPGVGPSARASSCKSRTAEEQDGRRPFCPRTRRRPSAGTRRPRRQWPWAVSSTTATCGRGPGRGARSATSSVRPSTATGGA
jgi:hypothetical protein